MRTRTLADVSKAGVMAELTKAFDAEVFVRDVLGAGSYERRGDEVWCACPLPLGLHRHGDSTWAFSVNEPKMVVNCFVCGGGDVIWAVQTVLECTAEEALAALRSAFVFDGIEDEGEFVAMLRAMWEEGGPAPSMPEYSPAVLRPWSHFSTYMDGRGVSREVQQAMHTGLDMENRELVQGEWVVVPRVVIPHFWEGRLVGWQKRTLIEWVMPKYRSSPGFPKQSTLYAWDLIDPSRPVVVVESPMSVLRMLTLGVGNVAGTFGAMVTDDQAALLRRYDDVIVFLDAGPAGERGSFSLADRLDAFTRVRVVPMGSFPDGTDPANFDADGLAELIGGAVPSLMLRRFA